MNTNQLPWRVDIEKDKKSGRGFCQPINNDDGRQGPSFCFFQSDGFKWALAAAENWIQAEPKDRLTGDLYDVRDNGATFELRERITGDVLARADGPHDGGIHPHLPGEL